MKVGTRSVLYGVHAFWFHPFTVLLACIKLDGIPNWKEIVCIFLHDRMYVGIELNPEYCRLGEQRIKEGK